MLKTRNGKSLVIFDGTGSYCHTALGLLAGIVPNNEGLAVTGLFTLYQLRESEPLPNKTGDFVEYLIGYVASSLIRRKTVDKLLHE